MSIKKSILTGIIIICSSLPLCTYAENVLDQAGDAVRDAGKGISNAAKNVGTAAEDAAITTKVKTKLALESDIPLKISITTTDHVVYISGTVDTGIQADRIIQIVESVDGVNSVNDSKLKIVSSDSYLSDAIITAKVKTKIMQLRETNKINTKNQLHVETTNGEVHILGYVTSSQDKDVIKAAVTQIGGVEGVSTNIDVKSE